MKIVQILGEIWTHLFCGINLNIAKLRYTYYYYFCIVADVALNYHSTTFVNNFTMQCGHMGRNVSKPLTGGQNLASS